MHKSYILLLLGVFAISVIGCTTPSTAYQVPKDEIKQPQTQPDVIVIFPKDFPKAKPVYKTSSDTQKYIEYANAMERLNMKLDQRRIEKEAEREKRYKEWQKKQAEDEARRQKLEEQRQKEDMEHWYRRNYWRYSNYFWSGIPYHYYYGWGLPLVGQRLIIWQAQNKTVVGPQNSGSTTYPIK